MRPLEHVMSITQSQNLKPIDPSQDLKHAQQAQILSEQNEKQKESISKISDHNNTELMNNIKSGLNNSSQQHFQENHESASQPEQQVVEKAILDEHNGKNIDIIC
ncbi:MAG: hypothetical protein ACRCVW_02680 [Brevinema sp.]